MRISMVAPHFDPEVGGVETSVRLLASWLVSRGHDVVVHTSARALDGRTLATRDTVDGVAVRRYPLRLNVGYFRSVFRPALEGSDLVHLHGYAVLTNDLAARRSPSPVVYSLHHGVSMPHPTPWTRAQRAGYDRFVGIPTLRRVNAVVAANRQDAAWLAARGITGVQVVPSPLPPEASVPGDADRARVRFGRRRFVLFLGRLHREKGVLDLVSAISHIPEVEAWFAGPDAGAAAEIGRMAAERKLSDRARLLGYVSEEVKRDLLAACEFLVLPSLYEAQGIAVAEAWAQGKPVVASRVGALEEWVEDGKTGLLVPPGDPKALGTAIVRLLQNPELVRALGEAGRMRCANVTIGRIGPQIESVYSRVVGSSAAATSEGVGRSG